MSHVIRKDATYTDANGQPADGYVEVTVFELPTVTVELLNTEPVYVGDEVVVSVTGTTDPDAGPGVAALDGVTASPDGLFRFTAV